MKKMTQKQEKLRFITLAEANFGFYECLESDDLENASSYFESVKQIYKNQIEDIYQELLLMVSPTNGKTGSILNVQKKILDELLVFEEIEKESDAEWLHMNI